jgi:hypothetical protein
MTGFVRTKDGVYVPVAEITHFRRKGDCAVIYTRDGLSYTLKDTETVGALISAYAAPIVPAAPGYRVIVANPVDKEWETNTVPVVGWARSNTLCDKFPLFGAVPVTVGVYEEVAAWALLTPNEEILCPNGNVYSDYWDWRGDLQTKAPKRKKVGSKRSKKDK